jgi:hypothetical protein
MSKKIVQYAVKCNETGMFGIYNDIESLKEYSGIFKTTQVYYGLSKAFNSTGGGRKIDPADIVCKFDAMGKVLEWWEDGKPIPLGECSDPRSICETCKHSYKHENTCSTGSEPDTFYQPRQLTDADLPDKEVKQPELTCRDCKWHKKYEQDGVECIRPDFHGMFTTLFVADSCNNFQPKDTDPNADVVQWCAKVRYEDSRERYYSPSRQENKTLQGIKSSGYEKVVAYLGLSKYLGVVSLKTIPPEIILCEYNAKGELVKDYRKERTTKPSADMIPRSTPKQWKVIHLPEDQDWQSMIAGTTEQLTKPNKQGEPTMSNTISKGKIAKAQETMDRMHGYEDSLSKAFTQKKEESNVYYELELVINRFATVPDDSVEGKTRLVCAVRSQMNFGRSASDLTDIRKATEITIAKQFNKAQAEYSNAVKPKAVPRATRSGRGSKKNDDSGAK